MIHHDDTVGRNRPTPPRLRRFGVGLALLGISTILCLLVVEGAVRLLIPQQLIAVWTDTFQPADSIGWMFKPNIDQPINTGEGTVRLVTDETGFRVAPERSASEDARVMLIGDSFMAAVQVEYEESFAARMEAGLSARMGRPMGVRNVSSGGWDPPQYLIKGRRMLAAHPVDLVVVSVYVGNDVVLEPMEIRAPLQPVRIHSFRVPRSLAAPELTDAIARPIDDRLKRRSHLYILLKNRVSYIRMQLGLSGAWFPDVHLRSLADSPRWGYTIDILEQIRDAAAEGGAATVFVLVPSHFQVDRAVLDQHVNAFNVNPAEVVIDQPNEILARGLRERGLEVLDPVSGMRRDYEERGQPLFGRVDTHLSVEGHRVLWDLVADDITRILGRVPPGQDLIHLSR
jgi:hypothetical protein